MKVKMFSADGVQLIPYLPGSGKARIRWSPLYGCWQVRSWDEYPDAVQRYLLGFARELNQRNIL